MGESRPTPRDERGRLLPGGGSLNPGGRPKYSPLLKEASPEAEALLISIMRGEVEDERISRGQAALAIHDRVHAKPVHEQGAATDKLAAVAELLEAKPDDKEPPPEEDDDDADDS